MESVTKGFEGAMSAVVDRLDQMGTRDTKDKKDKKVDPTTTDEEDPDTSDKLQSITGIKMEQDLPYIRDDDPDLDRHDEEFDSLISCFA